MGAVPGKNIGVSILRLQIKYVDILKIVGKDWKIRRKR